MFVFVLIVGLVLAIVGIILYRKYVKKLKINSVYCVTGAVKTGKTFVSVALAIKTYKKNLRQYYVKFALLWLLYQVSFHRIMKVKELEKPMLYSNISLRNIRYNVFTQDILLRKVRIPHRSVVLLDEVSLVADSMLYKDALINEQILEFIKLWGHYSHLGTLIFSTHSIADCHFGFKRGVGRFLYLFDNFKVPFFTIVRGMELINSEDNQSGVNNVVIGDAENSLRTMIFSSKYFKYYDCCCYSIFTDDLPLYVNYERRVLTRKDSLKCDVLVTLQDFKNLDRRRLD